VELIVVIVILAILAAIAIPALTGYIEKAKWQDMELRVKTQVTAFQTIVSEQYADSGSFKAHAQGSALPGDIFEIVTVLTDDGIVGFSDPTDHGEDEYAKLTGDTWSFDNSGLTSKLNRCWFVTDLSGAIKMYCYVRDKYFPEGERRHLSLIYANDVADPSISTLVGKYNTDLGGASVLTNGFNIIQIQTDANYNPVAIKLN
jgi:type II secretory pathway pseudopilin PulG